MTPLFAFDPETRRLVEALLGQPIDDDIRSVVLRVAHDEVVTLTVERLIDADRANDILHTFSEERLVTVGFHDE